MPVPRRHTFQPYTDLPQRRARARGGPRHGGFTLLELLVVMGIVVVLAGLLLPVLSRARGAADQAVCASNLRQWGMAVRAYAGQNDGFLPRRGQGAQPTNQISRPTDWFNALPPLLAMPSYQALAAQGRVPRPGGAPSVWLCPDATDPGGANYWSYGMNMGLSVWDAAVNNGKPDKLIAVGDPTVLVFLTDAPGNFCAVFPSQYPGGYNPVPRHHNRLNICFLDGHVAAVPGSSVGCGTGLIETADVRWHPPGNTWKSAP